MNVLFLNGSPRKGGYTEQLLKGIRAGLDSRHTVDWVDSYGLKIEPCHGCFKCRPNQPCCLPEDDGHDVWQKIRSADALVLGSPTYFGNISGSLKTIIDRNVTAFEEIAVSGLEAPVNLHKGKKAAMVTVCASSSPISQLKNQAQGALNAMESILMAGGYDIVGSVILDGTAALKVMPSETYEKAKAIGKKLLSE